MTNTFQFYRRVQKPVLRTKSVLGVPVKSWIDFEEDYVLVLIQMDDEITTLKTLFQQPRGSKTRRLLNKLLGEDSYGFRLEINGTPFIPE